MVVTPAEIERIQKEKEEAETRAQFEVLWKEIDKILANGSSVIDGDREFQYSYKSGGVQYSNFPVSLSTCNEIARLSVFSMYQKKGWTIDVHEEITTSGMWLWKEEMRKVYFKFHDGSKNSTEFTCKCGNQKGWITEGEIHKNPCPVCDRKYRGVYNEEKFTIEAIEI